MTEHTTKFPFNDYKHIPTRPEIDLLLGILPAIELKRFERQLENLEPNVNWAMQWYENECGWGYRGSYKSRVLCVLHFYKGFFTATLSIPLVKEQQFYELKELTRSFRDQFSNYRLSQKTKWVTFRISKKNHVDALLAITSLKLEDLKEKTQRK